MFSKWCCLIYKVLVTVYSVLRPVIKGLTSFPEWPLSQALDYNNTHIFICQHLFSLFFRYFSPFFDAYPQDFLFLWIRSSNIFYAIYPGASCPNTSVKPANFSTTRFGPYPATLYHPELNSRCHCIYHFKQIVPPPKPSIFLLPLLPPSADTPPSQSIPLAKIGPRDCSCSH